jgi:hypothetical protein
MIYNSHSQTEIAVAEKITDILVETGDPEALDRRVQGFKSAVIQTLDSPGERYLQHEGCYVIRCFGDPAFLEYMIGKQGYGKVVRRLDKPL